MATREEKRIINLDNGDQARAAFPLIVSASRSTDIPAFYADWFFERLKKGYSAWINPFNGQKYYIGYADTKFIVFWSKNPKPLLVHLDYLKERGIGCYIQYSLNDYEKEGLEPGVPRLGYRIETFMALAKHLGKGAVIWRFDPLLLTDTIGIDHLLDRIRAIGNQIHEYTEKLVFSFVDISSYKKVKSNIDAKRIPCREWTVSEMRVFVERLVELNKAEGWKLQLASCGEAEELPGISHNRCVDGRLILRLAHDSPELRDFLGATEIMVRKDLFGNAINVPPEAIDIGNGRYLFITKVNRDKGQRKACGCVKSKDIGQYDTCVHFCQYCYASHSQAKARRNHALHKANPHCETITGV